MALDLFHGPIPGQSLTKPLGSMPCENPPMHTDVNDALEHIFSLLTQPRQVTRLILMLKKGVPAEYIARSIIFMGFGKGMWTPDVGLMMLRSVIAMIVAIGHLKGIKSTILNPDKQQNDFLDQFLDMAPQNNPAETNTPQEATPVKVVPKFTGVLGGTA